MAIMEIIYWICGIVLFYCYAGYGIILYVLNFVKSIFTKVSHDKGFQWPSVTIIIAAWNEAEVLEQKIINTLELDYPTGKLHVICITDGSDDNSESIVQKYPSITLLHMPSRQGKVAALNRAIQFVEAPIVFFSDANAMLNKEAIKRMTSHFKDASIGGVAGEKKILKTVTSSVGRAEGLYWRYESFLKRQDAAFHSVVGAAGELFAIRTDLWRSLDENIILDDFIISMQVRLMGYRFSYEPTAWSMETPSISFAEERKRKVRIAAGAFQSMLYLNGALNFKKNATLSFQFFSRRILRWFVAPFLLPIFAIINFLVVLNEPSSFYIITFVAQIIFYLFALGGYILYKFNKKPRWLNAPMYFVFMNSCMISGSMLFFKNEHSAIWDKSLRESFE